MTDFKPATADPLSAAPLYRAQPEFLETIARLNGIAAAPAAQARVLQLGCRAGHDLLPWAERYPQASFLGIDRRPEAIEAAQQAARDLGLANVEFRCAELVKLGDQLDVFDYVVAHDVYGTHDAAGRDALLDICRDSLASHGIAYLDIRTYPGWSIRQMLRAMTLYDARHAATPDEARAAARGFLDFLQQALVEKRPYHALVQGTLAELRLGGGPDLWLDVLQSECQGVYLPDFLDHARRCSLACLGDAAFGIALADRLDAETERQLEALTPDPARQDLLRDMLVNRASRQMLLCHDAVAPNSPPSELPAGAYVASAVRAERDDVELASEEVMQFVAPDGRRLGSPLPAVKAALGHLGQIWPGWVSREDLIAAVTARLQDAAAPSAEDLRRLEASLLECCRAGIVELHAHAPSFATRISEAPLASSFARAQARTGERVTNRRHEAVRLEAFDRQLLVWLDGAHDRAGLAERLAADIAAAPGNLRSRPTTGEIDETLTRLLQAALLVA